MPRNRTSIKERVRNARAEAQKLYPVLTRQARRPFVLEITGTPKAGKTTLISMLDAFLRECGWRVHVLKERASECPLPMKGHFFFNTWTTGTMLAGLLDAVDREYDVVILDRGIFDALIWLTMQEKQGQVSQEERQAFEAFVLLDRWRQLVDKVCLIETEPRVAMQRENQSRLVPRSGSVMNLDRLAEFNKAMHGLGRRSRASFDLTTLSNKAGPKEGALQLIEAVIEAARAWCDPKIAVISRKDAEELVPTGAIAWSPGLQTRLLRRVRYERRSSVESDDRWVQIMACGVQTHAQEIFLVVRRPPRDRTPSARDNTALIWRGCHLTRPAHGGLKLQDFKAQLKARLQSDLHLGELKATPIPKGLVWDRDGKESRHLGAIFEVPVLHNLAEWLDEKNFKTNGRGYLLESSFVRLRELSDDRLKEKGYTVEEWSRRILAEGWLP